MSIAPINGPQPARHRRRAPGTAVETADEIGGKTTMSMRFTLSRPALALAVLSALVAACAEREVILPGEREPIRPALAAEEHQRADNESRPISLPAQSANAEWPQGHGTPAFRTAHPALRPAPQLAWATDIGQGDARRQRITAQPVVGGGRVYALDAGAQVSAVSTGGGVLWQTDLRPVTDKEGQATGGGLAYAGGTLYVSLGFGKLVALDATTGGIRWTQELKATGSGKPVVSGGILYLVAGDDTGWAINPADGRILWQTEVAPSTANVLGAPAPVVGSKYVTFAFGSGAVVTAFRQGGLRRWGASVSGQRKGRVITRYGDITGAPVLVGSTVYIGNFSGRIAAFDVDSGDRLWTARQGAMDPVWPVGGSLFAVTDESALARIDASTGETIWAVELPGFVKDRPRRRAAKFAHYGPVLAGGRVFVASNDGYLRAFAPQDGTLTAAIEVPGGATTPPTVAGQTLYVVNTKGELLAFR